MKILHVLPKYRHSNWSKIPNTQGFSFDYEVWHKAIQEEYGGKHQISAYFWDVDMIEKGQGVMNKSLLEVVERLKPDFIFFNVGGFELYPETIKKITAQTKTLYWCSDDSWRFDSVSKKFAPYYTWVASHPSSVVEKYKAMGCKTIFIHEGVRPALYHPIDPKDKDIEVSFCGTWNPQRGKTVEALQKHGISVYVRGKGWPEGELPGQEDVYRIMERSRITLILNPPSFSIGIKPLIRLFFKRPEFDSWWRKYGVEPDLLNFFDNIKEWLGKRNLQVKARHFETLACRTLGMTLYAEDLEKYYEIGKEIVVYKDITDLAEKIRYYLTHDEEREAIAEAGYQRTMREHTISKRLEHIFKTIGLET